jgi:arginase
LGIDFVDRGDLSIGEESTLAGGLKNFDPAFENFAQTRNQVREACANGSKVILIGGDHSNSIGSVSGAMSVFGEDLAVLWIDAHMDINTPATSPSGNLHGMVLGALMQLPFAVESGTTGLYQKGVADEQWSRLTTDIVGNPALNPKSVGWFAVRDVDQGEKDAYHSFEGGCMATMYDIDRHGIVEMVNRIDGWLKRIGAKKLWISFDVDSLDPFLAPGTGTAVRGGLTYREMHVMGELLHELLENPISPYTLAGLDIVEINPIVDTNNATAKTAVEWIASLFGKTILGRSAPIP